MSSMPARPSPCTARVRSEGPVARSTKRLSGGGIIATRAAKGLLSIHTLTAPGDVPLAVLRGTAHVEHDRALGHGLARLGDRRERLRDRPTIGSACERFFGDDAVEAGRLGRQPDHERAHEGIGRLRLERRVEPPLEADGGAGLGGHGAPAVEPGAVGRVHLDAVGQRQHAGREALVEVGGRALAPEVGPAHVAHEERVARSGRTTAPRRARGRSRGGRCCRACVPACG